MNGGQFWEKPDLKMFENHLRNSREQLLKSRQLLEKNVEALNRANKALTASNLLLCKKSSAKDKPAG